MGGTAYIIQGHLSEERLQPTPLPRNLLDTLLRRQRYARPVTHSMGVGTMTEVPCKELESIPRQFVEHLKERFQPPSDVDEVVLAYLNMRVTRTYVRIHRDMPDVADEEYVQVSFSGCAGMAEVCAMVAWHWFDRWYRDNAERLKKEILLPFGFEPAGSTDEASPDLFLPIAGVGYAAFIGGSGQSSPAEFELDGSVSDEGRAEAILHALNEEYADVFADHCCRCTLCSPGYPPVDLGL